MKKKLLILSVFTLSLLANKNICAQACVPNPFINFTGPSASICQATVDVSGVPFYKVNFGDGFTSAIISSSSITTHTYASAGTYTLITYGYSSLTSSVSCGMSTSPGLNIQCGATSINENYNSAISNIYPNPVKDELTVELKTVNQIKLNYEIVDALGKIILTNEIEGLQTKINTSGLSNGFYILNLKDENNNVLSSKKILK